MKLNRGHARRIFNWCKLAYGRSKYANYPTFSIRKFNDYDEGDLDGYYEPTENTVYINSEILDLNDLDYLVSTILEEYIHYTQSDAQYQKLAEVFDYEDHPYEISAKKISDRDSKKCIKHLKMFHKSFDL